MREVGRNHARSLRVGLTERFRVSRENAPADNSVARVSACTTFPEEKGRSAERAGARHANAELLPSFLSPLQFGASSDAALNVAPFGSSHVR